MESGFYSDKKVLVTGGTGLIGMALVKLLLQRGAQVRVAALDASEFLPEEVEFLQWDLLQGEACFEACRDMDYVFQLACRKASVGSGENHAVDFLEGNGLLNWYMLKAAQARHVKKYLYASSIGVYPDAEIFRENEVWNQPPHPSNRFASWGKRIGELLCEAYLEQFGYKTCIVRPANIYGPHDDFNPASAMAVPALIGRACRGEDPMVVWGDGTQVRDFLYVKDCARGLLLAMEKYHVSDPLNLGSGVGTTLRELVQTILRYAPHTPRLEWDTSKPIGNKIRLMDMTKTRERISFYPEYSLDQGIKETIEWYLGSRLNSGMAPSGR